MIVFLATAGILTIVQLKVENPLLLAERFIPGAGWGEIFLIGLYGAFLAGKMSDPASLAKWRRYSWTLFSMVFFGQLLLGILFSDKFLMTGKLHLPVPLMILSGPIYREQLSVMTFLFLSTVILSGPAWCSQLCYFGAMDNLFAQRRSNRGKLKNKFQIKHTALILIILITLILKFSGINSIFSLILASAFGVAGIAVMLIFSRKKGKMIHCILYCPIGTLVSYLKFLNPFRLKIDMQCTFCGSCSSVCRYDAMSMADLAKKRPGITCTLCGDCLNACEVSAIQYKFFNVKGQLAHRIYLGITITLHAVFLALARI
ncbi:MAG: 4Fe-4S binding protein [Bacteroidales bacterium]|nr:4Fe-4S binding protein [Bacteroidales bacterium]